MLSWLLREYVNVFIIIFPLIFHFIWTLLVACSSYICLLCSVLRLKVMGLSESVLSCLPFIARRLYLVDPLSACIYMYTSMPACRRNHAAAVCGLVVAVQARRYGIQVAGKWSDFGQMKDWDIVCLNATACVSLSQGWSEACLIFQFRTADTISPL